jgi:hypothetical protein
MVPHLFYYQLALLAIIWLFVMLPLSWLRRSAPPTTAPATPIKLKRSTEPKAQGDRILSCSGEHP